MNKYLQIFFSQISKKAFNILLIILFISVFLNVIQLPRMSYIDYIYNLINSTWFIAFFIIPLLLLINVKLSRYFENNYIAMSRYNKIELFHFKIKLSIYVTSMIFFAILVIMFIYVNIFGAYNNIFHLDDIYNVSNILLLIISTIKIYLFLIVLMIFNIGFLEVIKNKHWLVLLYLIFLVAVQNLEFLNNIPIITYFNPSRYIGINYSFSSFGINILQSFFYLLIILALSYFFAKRKVLNIEEIGDTI